MLSKEDFSEIIKNSPIFSLDLVIINEHDELLLGKRLNAPAKGFWFVPGGRVFKQERLEDAFLRISEAEIGCCLNRQDAHLLGIFDHIYEDSVFSSDISTHYINAAYFVKVKTTDLKLPLGEQHLHYRWLNLSEVKDDATVHTYSKIFLEKLLQVV